METKGGFSILNDILKYVPSSGRGFNKADLLFVSGTAAAMYDEIT